ncbi:MAG: ABC transporter ATP-binding protein, partial [Thermomicrobiales bacterium]
RSLAGYQAVTSGRVKRADGLQLAYLPQQPGSVFFCETVTEEIAWTLNRRGSNFSVSEVLEEFGLESKALSHPRDLSGGERERAAMAAVLVGDPQLILLDEPTRGMDVWRKAELVQILRRRQASGALVVLATHDVDLVAALATRVVVLGDGDVIADGSPRAVLAGSLSRSTQINRLLGSTWLTVDDVIADQERRRR